MAEFCSKATQKYLYIIHVLERSFFHDFQHVCHQVSTSGEKKAANTIKNDFDLYAFCLLKLIAEETLYRLGKKKINCWLYPVIQDAILGHAHFHSKKSKNTT